MMNSHDGPPDPFKKNQHLLKVPVAPQATAGGRSFKKDPVATHAEQVVLAKVPISSARAPQLPKFGM